MSMTKACLHLIESLIYYFCTDFRYSVSIDKCNHGKCKKNKEKSHYICKEIKG